MSSNRLDPPSTQFRACFTISPIMETSLDELRSPFFWRAVLAEVVATSLLVFFVCGSALAWSPPSPVPSDVLISFACACIIATIIYIFAQVSGAYINPAVTAAMLVTRKISLVRAIFYTVAQLGGALLGSTILMLLTPPSLRGTLGATLVSKEITVGQAFGIEFMMTFILLLAVCASMDTKRTDLQGSTPILIGLTVAGCHLFGMKYTGCSMNPAASFAPALVMGLWTDHWVYWCGPMLGGITGAVLYETIFAANSSCVKAKAYFLTMDYDTNRYEIIQQEESRSRSSTTVVDDKDTHWTHANGSSRPNHPTVA